jgi:hypothetical protein
MGVIFPYVWFSDVFLPINKHPEYKTNLTESIPSLLSISFIDLNIFEKFQDMTLELG